ncbi:MAG: LD-carboxypeptidase [Deltaproteobacteria bacterium]|nr:LD-carboxypeptidase [Deltaproteobacteria bacterium]
MFDDNLFHIGIIAPSSVILKSDLTNGVKKLKSNGFISIKTHPDCFKKHLFFASDQRARAFYEFAKDESIQILWCARGGYGAIRLLQQLKDYTKRFGTPPKKLLIGYSDITALHEFVRKQWHWSILHAPMPGVKEFVKIKKSGFNELKQIIYGNLKNTWLNEFKLKILQQTSKQNITGALAGGNLSVLCSLVGTQFAIQTENKILFLEDINEPLYKIDRMMQQMALSGNLTNIKALVLGSFGEMTSQLAFREIFQSLGKHFQFPVFYGLPVGHEKNNFPLPLGGQYNIDERGIIQLLDWEWKQY